MNILLKNIACVSVAGLLAACGAGDGGEYSASDPVASAGAEGTSTVPGAGAGSGHLLDSTTPDSAAESSSAPELQRDGTAVDPAFKGLQPLGQVDGWRVFFDEEHSHVILNDGESTLTFDPNRLDDATIESLVKSGVPEELLWSWKGAVCRTACSALGGLGCTLVTATCEFGSVFSFAGFSFPCSIVLAAVCQGNVNVCKNWCTAKYG